MAAVSPVTAKTDLVSYSIKSNGSPIDDTYQVTGIHVHKAVNKISICEIEISDGNASTEDFPVSDGKTFIPGNKIEVEAGYEEQNQLIFKGVIMKQSIKISKGSGPVLMVECKDEAVKMTVGRTNAYFSNTTDSDIISKIMAKYSLQADVTSTQNQLKEVIQYYTTDWDFIVSRADVNGLVVALNDGSVKVQSPDEMTTEVLKLTYGNDILEFDGTLNAESQLKKVNAFAWDMKSQKLSTGKSTLGNSQISNVTGDTLSEVLGLSSFDLQSAGFLDIDMLGTWAKAKTTKSKYAKVRGEVKCQGNAGAIPGSLVVLDGVGERFNGKGFISGVYQDIVDGNWVTTIEIGLSTNWFTSEVRTEAPIASGLLPGIQGLQIGKVKQINDDPDGEFRVLVTFPLIQTSQDGVWARLSNLYATSNAGTFFFPEVEDEVIVGFFNDDPRYPVILGSMYSSSNAPPYQPDEKNNTKAIVSRTQMKVEFDEENKVITITTPQENMIVLSDKEKSITMSDENSNSIKMSEEGIDITSASNINIKAQEGLTTSAGTETKIEVSGGDLTMQAMNISGSADMEMKMQGEAAAQVTASGEVTIQGAMVLINS